MRFCRFGFLWLRCLSMGRLSMGSLSMGSLSMSCLCWLSTSTILF